jgi:hypothetical protein
MRHHALAVVATGAALAALTLVGCGGASTPADFSLLQRPPHLEAVDQGAPGASTADIDVFDAQLTKDGASFGRLYGEQTVEAETASSAAHVAVETRMTDLIFDLPDGQIVVHGASAYPRGNWHLHAGTPVVRAIVGGTKAYVGARGELTTTRNANGSYTQAFHFVG